VLAYRALVAVVCLWPALSVNPTPNPRIKVCCIRNLEEAWLAIDCGASALGLVSEMPSGPGVIEEAVIAEIAARIPPGISSFLLTSKQDAGSIIAQQHLTRVNTIQICDRVEPGGHARLRQALPGIALVQVIHVTGSESVDEAVVIAPQVDALLLDSGNQSLAVKELGGTGRRHDWKLSRQIREAVDVPIFLAGGLTPENVGEAIAAVEPFGLDLCTGVRINGQLDRNRLVEFFGKVRMA